MSPTVPTEGGVAVADALQVGARFVGAGNETACNVNGLLLVLARGVLGSALHRGIVESGSICCFELVVQV